MPDGYIQQFRFTQDYDDQFGIAVIGLHQSKQGTPGGQAEKDFLYIVTSKFISQLMASRLLHVVTKFRISML